MAMRSINLNDFTRYIPYPMAMGLLDMRLKTTPEELALWIFQGTKDGGIAAYTNVNEFDPPLRFEFTYFTCSDYLASLMAVWFLEEDITNFQPSDRFITGKELLDRWSKYPYINPRDFIIAKIHESRLTGMHPTFGVTKESFPEWENFPSFESGLFAMSKITAIEEEDFVLTQANTFKNKSPQAFIDVLSRLLKEIECRSSAKGTTIQKSCMPGTKANLQTVASKFDAALDGFSPQTFDDYLEGICQFKKGRPPTGAKNPYTELFPEYF